MLKWLQKNRGLMIVVVMAILTLVTFGCGGDLENDHEMEELPTENGDMDPGGVPPY